MLVILIHRFNRLRLQKKEHVIRLACSVGAGCWMFGNKSFSVVQNAIDLRKFANSTTVQKKLCRDGSEKLLLSIGRLEPQKNHLFLFPVIAEVVKMNPEIRLWIAGEGSLRTKLEKCIIEYGLQRNIRLLGDQSEIADLLKQADLYLMPSLLEGFGIAAIEAQASGVPCILSNGIPAEAVKGKNVMRIPLEKDAWVQAIIHMLNEGKFEYENAELLERAGYGLSYLRTVMLNIYGRKGFC